MKIGDAVALSDGQGGRITAVEGDALTVTIRGEGKQYHRSDVTSHYPVIPREDVRKVWAEMCRSSTR